jgi:hypothetical protein
MVALTPSKLHRRSAELAAHVEDSPSPFEELRGFWEQPSDAPPLNPYPRARMTPYGEQDEHGVDWSLIRSQLRLTPWERALTNSREATAALRLLKEKRLNAGRARTQVG